MVALVDSVTEKEGATLPSTISYSDKTDPIKQRNSQYSDFFRAPQIIGTFLRNAFFLPLYKKEIDHDLELDQQLSIKIAHALKNSHAVDSKELHTIQQHFSIRDVAVQIEGPIPRTFTVRLFESKIPINDKKLRIILFSFNGNTEKQKDTQPRRWEPLSIRDLSEGPLHVLKALKACGIRVDSLVTSSLGNVTLDGLKYHSKALADQAIIPSTLVINRGLTSVKKVAYQLYPWPLSYLLYAAARWSTWDADPEQEILNFLKNEPVSERQKRKIVIIEALKDFYFSNKGGFDHNFHKKIAQLSISVFRASFYPFPFHVRSHHALSLNHLVCNLVTQVPINTTSLSLGMNEKMSSVIARDIFLSGAEEYHTCFYICGNDASLDKGAVREALPLLSAFIEEGDKMAQQNDRKQVA